MRQHFDQAKAQDLCALARATAAKVGCTAMRWWLDERDLHRLWIAAVCPPVKADPIMVVLEARIAAPPPQ